LRGLFVTIIGEIHSSKLFFGCNTLQHFFFDFFLQKGTFQLDGMRGRFGFGFLNYRGAPRAGFSARFCVFSGKIDISMRGK